MTASEELIKQALALPKSERASLAAKLLRTLDEEPADPDAEQLWAEEVERRVKALDEGTLKTVSWDEVRAQLLDKERKRGA